MVVITIVLVLSGITAIERQRIASQLNLRSCTIYQSQIVAAMIVYSTTEETGWPDPRGAGSAWKLPAGPITTALDGAKYTAGAFEMLAASQSIPNHSFECPGASGGGPNKKAKASLGETSVLWGWDPTAGVAVSYAFDWASPADSGSQRVILADRDPENHNLSVMAAFGDAHVKKLKLVKVVRGTGVLVTETGITAPHQFGTSIQPDDDIFSAEGDAGDPLTPGKGDPLRAWVK